MRRRLVALFSLFFVSLLLAQFLTALTPQKALAVGKTYSKGQEVKEFCTPEIKQFGSNRDNNEPVGWLSARFIDRATIELTYNNGHKCDKLVGDTDFGPLFAGKDNHYVDGNIGDGDYDYRNTTTKDNNGGSRIRTFGNGCGSKTDDHLGAHDRVLSTDEINNDCLRSGPGGVELDLSINENNIPGYNCVDDEGSDHFAFANQGGDGLANYWQCTSGSGHTYVTKDHHGVVITNDFTNIDGFNITYVVFKDSTSATSIQHVSAAVRGNRTFTKCNNGYNNGNNCSGDLELLDSNGQPLAYGALDSLGTKNQDIFIAKVSDPSKRTTVRVAGATSEAGQAAVASGGFQGDSKGASHPTCESVGGPLSWILCAIFNGMAGFADWMLNNVVQPLLHTSPISTDPNDGTFKIWSTFRIYGNLILVIALLVLVIGQSFGGGLIDAYTAKKMVPRILIAAILINLSVYIVAAAVDITNIVGGGLGGLLIGPFRANAQFVFTPNGIQRVGAVVGGGGGTIAAFLGGLIFVDSAIKGAAFLALFVLLPAVLAIIGAFVTIIIRQGLILLLVLISPLAFALYCLPNTEQYFKKWWDLFFKTLLVYPIIIAIFAIADIMTVTIMKANSIGGDKPLLTSVPANLLAGLVAFVVQFLPLALIPFAFKFAGGAVGSIYGALSGNSGKLTEFIKGNSNDPNSLRRRVSKDFRSARISGRGASVHALNKRTLDIGQGTTGRLGAWQRAQRRGISIVAGGLYRGGGLERDRSNLNKEEAERIATQQGYGADDTIRKAWAKESNGRFFEYATGAEVAPQAVYAARRNLGNISAYQEALAYEQTKANNDGTYGQLKERYLQVAEEQGWSEYDARGMWTGAAFKNKGLRLEQKHDFVVKDKNTGHFEFKGVNYDTFSEEFGQKIRSFQAGDLQSSSFGTMEDAMEDAVGLAPAGDGTRAVGPYLPTAQTLDDDSPELHRLQYLYHGLTNLEIPTYGSPGGEGAPPGGAPTPTGTRDTRMSFGGAGIPAAAAQQAVDHIKRLAEADPRITQTPPGVGISTPQPLTPPR